jgi:hypothetical protein
MNKPRVFLSHSKKDSEFIEKIDADLRKCQIETWLDTVEIRHGKSWQDSIFQYGLPSCDAIIVYFTEQSIQSSVVKKEMDAGLLQNLQDNSVAFLPYVSDQSLRVELRSDIQALQVPEWNAENYYMALPRVVSEIWRSYLERVVSTSLKNEQLKRVEAELELEKYKNQLDDVFSKSEIKEFQFLEKTLDNMIRLVVLEGYVDTNRTHRYRELYFGRISLLSIVARLSDLLSERYYERGLVRSSINKQIAGLLSEEKGDEYDLTVELDESFRDLTTQLQTLGLIEQFTFTAYSEGSEYLDQRFDLTKKYFRFRYWLIYQKIFPNQLVIEFDK